MCRSPKSPGMRSTVGGKRNKAENAATGEQRDRLRGVVVGRIGHGQRQDRIGLGRPGERRQRKHPHMAQKSGAEFRDRHRISWPRGRICQRHVQRPGKGLCHVLLGDEAKTRARQIDGAAVARELTRHHLIYAGFAPCMLAVTLLVASLQRYEPDARNCPVAAVSELKALNLTRVFNEYDFGGYLIASGVATFIDGRAELFGEKFIVDDHAATGLI
jgi:hypothetical protein